ncbi:MAG: tRNA (adenine-N(6)-)-methyltransferase [Thermoplasmata archaeon]|nr:tRNA (adenine-N(6)-)-methyltransferase [Thermoplasmata archaeon]
MIQKSQDVAYSNGGNDECMTPDYGVVPILKYIPAGKVVWCPFDTEESNFVKLISRQNEVIFTHIDMGRDFYTYEPSQNWDIIVSNPPFTGKRKIFERALSFNKPFALIMANTFLNDSAPMQIFKDRDLQLLMFDKRIQYNDLNKITFSSSYFCWHFLPKQIIMEHLERKTPKREIQ